MTGVSILPSVSSVSKIHAGESYILRCTQDSSVRSAELVVYARILGLYLDLLNGLGAELIRTDC